MSNSAHFVANKRAAYEVPVRIRIFFDVAVITLSLDVVATLSLVVVASAQSPAPPELSLLTEERLPVSRIASFRITARAKGDVR